MKFVKIFCNLGLGNDSIFLQFEKFGNFSNSNDFLKFKTYSAIGAVFAIFLIRNILEIEQIGSSANFVIWEICAIFEILPIFLIFWNFGIFLQSENLGNPWNCCDFFVIYKIFWNLLNYVNFGIFSWNSWTYSLKNMNSFYRNKFYMTYSETFISLYGQLKPKWTWPSHVPLGMSSTYIEQHVPIWRWLLSRY